LNEIPLLFFIFSSDDIGFLFIFNSKSKFIFSIDYLIFVMDLRYVCLYEWNDAFQLR
jgi:hypothetical protein